MLNILLVEDDKSLQDAIKDTLEINNFICHTVNDGFEAKLALKRKVFNLILTDIQMPKITGIELLQYLNQEKINTPVLLMSAYTNVKDAVFALKNGACDYIQKPFSPDLLVKKIKNYANVPYSFEKNSPVAVDQKSIILMDKAKKIAKTDATVMLTGASGSGKEIISRYIHNNSKRKNKKFVAINCAAIPDNMLESTLFGYEKGAFTGALQKYQGKFEEAQNSTLLLDEITEMDLRLQTKLLRVLQEKEVEPIGSKKTIKLDVRIIATSNRNLKEYVKQGKFREDLYYRLNVLPLKISPLNQRKDDILPLCEFILSQKNKTKKINIEQKAKDFLKNYSWPGNIRELENVIIRALALCQTNTITLSDLETEEEFAL